ncbi:MAG: hypothetical protein N2558_01245 [Patescibacteria group bacterium]|nr:hypothetical protein [Patescibacteria group bacterium]
MHAYLFVGNQENLKNNVNNLAKKISAHVYPMQIKSIKDVNVISSFIKLAQNQKIIITIENIQNASNEALQAFLKDLEEPQKNVYFALHALNESNLLPTIISRCQVIYIGNKNNFKKDPSLLKEYFSVPLQEKLNIIDNLKDRNETIEFLDDILKLQHQILLKNPNLEMVRDIEIVQKTKRNIMLNGNLFLHLSQMTISLSQTKKTSA